MKYRSGRYFASINLLPDIRDGLILSMKEQIVPLVREVVGEANTAAPELRWIGRKIGSCFLPEAIT